MFIHTYTSTKTNDQCVHFVIGLISLHMAHEDDLRRVSSQLGNSTFTLDRDIISR